MSNTDPVAATAGVEDEPGQDGPPRVTPHTRPTRRVRYLAGRRDALAQSDVPTLKNNDGDSSPTGLSSSEQRLTAVVWSRNLLAGIPAPLPHRFHFPRNRGALVESTPHAGKRRRRHASYARNVDQLVAGSASRSPVDPARGLPHPRLQTVRHACVSGRFSAARLGSPCSPCGWSGHDVNAEGAPPTRMAPQLPLFPIGLGFRPDDGQSSGRSTRGRLYGAPDGRPTFGARR
jgi:hypothetical protein